ncbi:MAG: hypothetical protein JRM82_01705 [Nitrososphaerota archaeon]|nr:hypothetical protein [Nitrososphaerota archaeon]
MTDIVLVSVALLVGYPFRRRFEYTPKGIFLTCATSSFLVILAISLAMVAPEVSDTRVVSNPALFLLGPFVSSVAWGTVVALLITAGAVVGGRAVERKQISSA